MCLRNPFLALHMHTHSNTNVKFLQGYFNITDGAGVYEGAHGIVTYMAHTNLTDLTFTSYYAGSFDY